MITPYSKYVLLAICTRSDFDVLELGEICFDLQSIWHIIRYSSRFASLEKVQTILDCFLILHNMMLEERHFAYLSDMYEFATSILSVTGQYKCIRYSYVFKCCVTHLLCLDLALGFMRWVG